MAVGSACPANGQAILGHFGHAPAEEFCQPVYKPGPSHEARQRDLEKCRSKGRDNRVEALIGKGRASASANRKEHHGKLAARLGKLQHFPADIHGGNLATARIVTQVLSRSDSDFQHSA